MLAKSLTSRELCATSRGPSRFYFVGKRFLDIFVSCLLLIVLTPAVLLIALAIKLTSKGPVLYRQDRVGLDGEIFSLLKFRTMTPNAGELVLTDEGLRQAYVESGYKLVGDWHALYTPIGHWLRRSSIDELPQLWNVLCGQMTIIGPRPVVPDELCMYGEVIPIYLSVKPGMTGMWQIHGRSNTTYERRVELDAYYVENRSLALDLMILARTPRVVLSRTGAH